MTGQYADFGRVTSDALSFAAKSLGIEISRDNSALLMNAWLALKSWPDAPAALRKLKERGLRLAFLSNLTPWMLDAAIHNSDLEGVFDHVLSTDRVQAYKPDPRAYRMAVEAFRLRPEEIAFAAFAGWGAAGARAFGYRTFWVNRQNQPAEELGSAAQATGSTLNDLADYLAA